MDLSDDGKAMLLGVFLSPKAKLTMQNQISVLSARAHNGLEDLIKNGLAIATSDGIAVTYELTEAGRQFDRRSISSNPFLWMKTHGDFPIAVKRKDAAQ